MNKIICKCIFKQKKVIIMFMRLFFICLLINLVSCSTDGAKKDVSEKVVQETKTNDKKKNSATTKKMNLPASVAGMKKLKGQPRVQISTINGEKAQINKKPISLKIAGKKTVIKGWAIDKVAKTSASEIYVKVGNKFYKAKSGIKSANLAKKMKNPNLGNSGFQVNVNNKVFNKSTQPFAVLVVNKQKNGYWISKENQIVIK